MKRAISLQDSVQRGPRISSSRRGGAQNAEWESTSNAQHSSASRDTSLPAGATTNGRSSVNTTHLHQSAAHVLFLNNRRGSNGIIPGQQLASFPVPVAGPLRQNSSGLENSTTMGLREPSELVNDHSLAGDLMNAVIGRHGKGNCRQRSRIYDDPAVIAGYNSVPLIELDRLPRGGISLETKSIGRIQVCCKPLIILVRPYWTRSLVDF